MMPFSMCKIFRNCCPNTIDGCKYHKLVECLLEFKALFWYHARWVLVNLFKYACCFEESDKHQNEEEYCTYSMNCIYSCSSIKWSHCEDEKEDCYCLEPESCLWYLYLSSGVSLCCLGQPPKSNVNYYLHHWCYIDHNPSERNIPWVVIGSLRNWSWWPRRYLAIHLSYYLCQNACELGGKSYYEREDIRLHWYFIILFKVKWK